MLQGWLHDQASSALYIKTDINSDIERWESKVLIIFY